MHDEAAQGFFPRGALSSTRSCSSCHACVAQPWPPPVERGLARPANVWDRHGEPHRALGRRQGGGKRPGAPWLWAARARPPPGRPAVHWSRGGTLWCACGSPQNSKGRPGLRLGALPELGQVRPWWLDFGELRDGLFRDEHEGEGGWQEGMESKELGSHKMKSRGCQNIHLLNLSEFLEMHRLTISSRDCIWHFGN
jgi:hypothetical protein